MNHSHARFGLVQRTPSNDRLRRDGFRVRIGSQIHFDTLSDSARWTRCSGLLRDVPRVLLDDLAFHVVGIEDGVPSSRLQAALSKLAKVSRFIYCVVKDGGAVGLRFSGTGAHAVGMVMRKGPGSERHQIEKVQRLANQASAHGLEAFILNASTPSIALNAIASGIRYVEGDVISAPTADPRYGFIRGIEDLYLRKFKRLPETQPTLV